MATLRIGTKIASSDTSTTNILQGFDTDVSNLFTSFSSMSSNQLSQQTSLIEAQLAVSALRDQFNAVQMQSRLAQDSYNQALMAQRQSRAAALRLLSEKEASDEKFLKLREELAVFNVSKLINTATNLSQAASLDLKRGATLARIQSGQAVSAYAAAGVQVGTGSAAYVEEALGRETFRDVTQNFKQSMNQVGEFLTEAFNIKLQSRLDRLTVEEQNRLQRIAIESQVD